MNPASHSDVSVKMRRIMRRIALLFTTVAALSAATVAFAPAGAAYGAENGEAGTRTPDGSDSTMLYNLTATDVFGRSAPDVAGYRKDRYVGLFYFTWMGQQGEKQETVYDITKLLRSNREELFSTADGNRIAPNGVNYFFNEPLFGYYNSADPYIIRKHLELFIAAGVDFIALDFTNAIYYGDVLGVMLDLYLDYQNAGFPVPKIMFFTKTDSGNMVTRLYRNLYQKEKYDSLWFRAGGDKPYIIAAPEELSDKMLDFFEVRPPQWPEDEYREDGWPYVEKVRPQRLFTDLMSVSVAQHTGDAFSFSVQGPLGTVKESWGRGYTSRKPENGDVDAIMRGDNFQEEWDTAIAADPEIVFVTGWNEWTALKLTADWAGDTPLWVDTFNTEFSRDIEMTRAKAYVPDGNGGYAEEGYGDNYYISLLSNIRRYKGIALETDNYTAPVTKTIDLYGDDSQWDDIKDSYRNISIGKLSRDSYGYLETEEFRYVQAAPDNQVRSVKVTHDSENVYFRIETFDDILTGSESGGQPSGRMNLLIGAYPSDTGKMSSPAWEGFGYIINRHPVSAELTSIERVNKDGAYSFEDAGTVSCSIRGKIMLVSVPVKSLGIEKAGDGFRLQFKVTDSIEHPEDILDYYVSGCSAPIGRLAYTYSAMTAEQYAAYRENLQKDNKKDTGGGLSVTDGILIGAGCAAALLACGGGIIGYKRKKSSQKNA